MTILMIMLNNCPDGLDEPGTEAAARHSALPCHSVLPRPLCLCSPITIIINCIVVIIDSSLTPNLPTNIIPINIA